MFSIKESLKYAWYKCKENWKLVFWTTLFVIALESLLGEIDQKDNFGFFILGVIGTILLVIVRIGYTKIFLRIYDGETPKFADIFKEYEYFWRFIGVSILTVLTILGGLILLIIPGLFWAVRFSLSPLIVLDTKIGPVAAMKESYALTKGSFWKLVLFGLTLLGINILGVLALGVGILVSVPLSLMAYVQIYRTLSQKKAGLVSASSPQTA